MKKKKHIQKQLNNLLVVGKKYHFFDDGKCSPSRHYIATVEEIISSKDAKNRYFESCFTPKVLRPLYDIWKDNVATANFLYAEKTDVFVRCSIPKYDEHQIWFVRTKDGSLFSINVQSGWQSGILDINGSIYESVKNEMDSNKYPGWYDEASGCETINLK